MSTPAHYPEGVYEPIKVIEAWGLGFSLGNVLKYIARAGKKDGRVADLQKALYYLEREIGPVGLQKEHPSSSCPCVQCEKWSASLGLSYTGRAPR